MSLLSRKGIDLIGKYARIINPNAIIPSSSSQVTVTLERETRSRTTTATSQNADVDYIRTVQMINASYSQRDGENTLFDGEHWTSTDGGRGEMWGFRRPTLVPHGVAALFLFAFWEGGFHVDYPVMS